MAEIPQFNSYIKSREDNRKFKKASEEVLKTELAAAITESKQLDPLFNDVLAGAVDLQKG